MRTGPGAPRKADSVLMAIRALIMEFESHSDPGIIHYHNLIRKIKATYGHGGKMVAQMYVDKLKEIDEEIHRLGEKHFRTEKE